MIQAYKFNKNATSDKPEILNGKTPQEFLKEKFLHQHSFGLTELHRYGNYKLAGWSFDFKPYLKLFVFRQYNTWQQAYAPNKTLLRKSIFGVIDKIVLVD